MNDPHVVSLTYLFEHDPTVDYRRAAPLTHETATCTAHLRQGLLTVNPRDHFPNSEAARAVMEPFIRSWAAAATLATPDRPISFQYRHCEIVDRAPAAGGLLTGSFVVATATVATKVTSETFPSPPRCFRATPLVEAMLVQFQIARQYPRIASAAAYFCLTAAKTRVRQANWKGKECSDRVAAELAMAPAIFDHLWRLSTDIGGLHSGRKISDKAEIERPRPGHSTVDLAWLYEAMRLLIQRLGEWEADPTALRSITLADLPAL